MRKNRRKIVSAFLLFFVLLNSACAQIPSGKAYVAEELLVQNSTVLLNNASYAIPLQNLGSLKIAGVHFSNPYAAGFDSLLNKYTKVDTFNGNVYTGAKSLNDLSFDLKWYNTIIVQLNNADVNNPQIINFITQTQKVKNVIVALFGDGSSLAKLNDISAPVIWSERVSLVSAFFSAQAIFGGVPITQKLANTYSPHYATGMGF